MRVSTYFAGVNLSRQLFGTDGIRGVAGEAPLDARTAHALGFALGTWACKQPESASHDPEVVIGMDTRESGQWLAEEVAGGLARAGVRARFAGVITTPGRRLLNPHRTVCGGRHDIGVAQSLSRQRP